MSELLSWLRSTIEGDKVTAELAASGERDGVTFTGFWTHTYGGRAVRQEGCPSGADGIVSGSCGCCFPEATGHAEDLEHIARHDPRDTIARCEAELALLDLHEHVETSPLAYRLVAGKCQPFGCSVCHEKDQIVWGEGVCATLRQLAAGRRHRPGFKSEWVEG